MHNVHPCRGLEKAKKTCNSSRCRIANLAFFILFQHQTQQDKQNLTNLNYVHKQNLINLNYVY